MYFPSGGTSALVFVNKLRVLTRLALQLQTRRIVASPKSPALVAIWVLAEITPHMGEGLAKRVRREFRHLDNGKSLSP